MTPAPSCGIVASTLCGGSQRAVVARRDAVRWFSFAVGALGLAGLLAVVLVVGRVPVIASTVIRDSDFARRSLVVHVNLAMGVWFYACLAGLYCLLPGPQRFRTAPWALLLSIAGAITFTVPVLSAAATPVLSNYVATLDHPAFLAGLVVFVAGILLSFAGLRLLPVGESSASHSLLPIDAQYAVKAAALAFVVALLTFAGAAYGVRGESDLLTYYERLFWGGGHVLQAVNTLGMFAAWLILLQRLTGCATIGARRSILLFGTLLVPHLAGPWLTFGGYSSHWFTRMMQYGLFPAATVLMIVGGVALWRGRVRVAAGPLQNPALIGLATSAAMTCAGFALGAMITADTTLVPAHYHANIGAVSVAYMAVLLVLFREMGATIFWPRLAAWQPLMYGVGQMTFVLGLAVAGTLGQAARKSYGTEQQLHTTAEWIGLGIVGIGGVFALGGGVLFIVIAARALGSVDRHSFTTQHPVHSRTQVGPTATDCMTMAQCDSSLDGECR